MIYCLMQEQECSQQELVLAALHALGQNRQRHSPGLELAYTLLAVMIQTSVALQQDSSPHTALQTEQRFDPSVLAAELVCMLSALIAGVSSPATAVSLQQPALDLATVLRDSSPHTDLHSLVPSLTAVVRRDAGLTVPLELVPEADSLPAVKQGALLQSFDTAVPLLRLVFAVRPMG